MLIHATAESLLKRSCWRLIQSMSIPILVVSTPWCCGTVHTYIRRLKCAVWWGNVLVNYVYFWRENCQCLSRERQLVFTCTCMYPLPNPAGAYVRTSRSLNLQPWPLFAHGTQQLMSSRHLVHDGYKKTVASTYLTRHKIQQTVPAYVHTYIHT